MNICDFVIDYSVRFYDCWVECGWGIVKLDGSYLGLVGWDIFVEIWIGIGYLFRI